MLYILCLASGGISGKCSQIPKFKIVTTIEWYRGESSQSVIFILQFAIIQILWALKFEIADDKLNSCNNIWILMNWKWILKTIDKNLCITEKSISATKGPSANEIQKHSESKLSDGHYVRFIRCTNRVAEYTHQRHKFL